MDGNAEFRVHFRCSDPVTEHFDTETQKERKRFFLGLVCIPLPKYDVTMFFN